MSLVNRFRFPTSRRSLILNGSVGFIIGAILFLTLFNFVGLPKIMAPFNEVPRELLRFSSYRELTNFLNRTVSYYYVTPNGQMKFFGTMMSAENAGGTTPEYSQTNIQVEGVDEADIVKCDGEYIYYVLEKNLTIVKAYPPENARVVSKVSFNGVIRGLFVNNNRLVVFEDSPIEYYQYGAINTSIRVYNIEDRAKPILVREVAIDGRYFTSRMIENHVYLIANQYTFIKDNNVTLPTITDNGQLEKIPISKIYYSNNTDYSYTFTIVISIDMTNLEAPKYEVILTGTTGTVYVSRDNIYLTIQKTPIFYAFTRTSNIQEKMDATEVYRIHISDGEIRYEGSGVFPGRVLNQFSMDEYNEYFRVATTTGQVTASQNAYTSMNHIYILNEDLNITGKLEDIAPGETIYSARFMGERCYLVTFRKIDPFFVIDVKDPNSPRMLGNLKITGYSSYLHPYDETHIIGIGKETVAAEEGDFSWYQGLKISIFDVADVEHPIEVAKQVIGDRGTDSPILSDHKALLFDKKRNLLAIPILVAEIDKAKYPQGIPNNTYGDYVWQGVYVFNMTQSELTVRGRITHIENQDVFEKSGWYFSTPYNIKRALYIDDVLYTISDKKIKMNNLTSLNEIGQVQLP